MILIFRPLKKWRRLIGYLLLLISLSYCTSSQKLESFPKGLAFIDEVYREHEDLGTLRLKINFKTYDDLEEATDEKSPSCVRHYLQAVDKMIAMAKKKGGHAIKNVRTVVLMDNGEIQLHKTPQCADDGMEGQILLQAQAIAWKNRSPNTK